MFDLPKIAKLSRLNMSPELMKTLEPQMNDILAYVETLQKADTSSVDGFGLVETGTVMRPDQPVSGGSREERVSLSASHQSGMFLVPKVIGGDESA
jgi:aspartyl/glutamyl-tRNA(Asn/Gln) amidotransferase C subunit